MSRPPKKAPPRPAKVVAKPTRRGDFTGTRKTVEPELVATTALAVIAPDGRPPVPRGAPPVVSEAGRRILAGWLEDVSGDTCKSYFASARHFAAWLVAEGHVRARGHAWDIIATALQVPEDEGTLLVEDWIRSQSDENQSSVATRCSGVRRLLRKLKAAGAIAYVPDFKRPRVLALTPRERAAKYAGVAKAFDAVVAGLEGLVENPRASAIDVRDWAIVRHVAAMGLRRVEIVGPQGLQIAHIDFALGQIATRGKGRRRREQLRMPPALVPVLHRWLRVRAGVVREGCEALYIALERRGRGGPITDRGTINAMLRRRAVQFGVQLRPHDLRRIMCTEALARYGSRKAREITRHASESTVMLYDLEQGQAADAMADEVGAALAQRGKKKGRRR